MNYLAHLYLAGPGPEAKLGALLGDGVTSRNWATMQKLHALLNGSESAATSAKER